MTPGRRNHFSIPRSLLGAVIGLLAAASSASAGTITGMSVTEGSVETTAVTTYTFTFTPPTTINSGNWSDGVYFWFDFDNDFTVSSATLGSITPPIAGMSINNLNDSNGTIRMYSGNGSAQITGGQQYTVVLNSIQNPALAQTPDNHQIRTGDGSSIVDTGAVSATPITSGATNPPVVQVLIPDAPGLFEADGLVEHVANLNNNFLDGDGDTMTYSAVSSDPTTVSVSLSGPNNRTLSLEAHRYGSATVTVTATAVDGSVDDTFTVTTIGEIPIASVSEGSLIVSDSTSYTFVFTPETTINSLTWSDGAYFAFDLDDDFTVSGATLGSITPSIPGMAITSTNDSSGRILMVTTTGEITGGQQYIVVLNGVQNPGTPQTPDAHVIRTLDGGSGTIDEGTIAAKAVTAAPTNPPTVQQVIPDVVDLEESAGVVEHVSDLNTHFIDIDGDTMGFSAVSSDPSTVAVSLSGPNNQTLSILALRFGAADVTVTATSIDGSADDTFSVTTIGALSVDSVAEGSLDSSASTTYTFQVTPETGISSANWSDGAYFVFDLDDDFAVSGATLGSITPAIPGMAINSTSDTNGRIQMVTSTGEIVGGQQYTVVLNGVQNPATPQTPVAHRISTGDGTETVDTGIIAANPIAEASSPPEVDVAIPDKNLLEESEGIVEYVTDLNDHFNDPDGDTIDFAAVSSDPSIVQVSLSGANNRTLSLQALRFGEVDVTVTATATDGSVQDVFMVTTIGTLIAETMAPDISNAGEMETYSFVVTLESPASTAGGDGAYIEFDLPDEFVANGFTEVLSISPAIPGGFTTSLDAGTSTVSYRGVNTVPAGTYLVDIGGVTNPTLTGIYGDVGVETHNGGGTTFDRGVVAGPEILEAGLVVFADGFEVRDTSRWSSQVP
jgi:hypothetical protein